YEVKKKKKERGKRRKKMDYSYYDNQSGEDRYPGGSSSSQYNDRRRRSINPRWSLESSQNSPLLGSSPYCDRHPGQIRRPSQIPPYYQSMALASNIQQQPQPQQSTSNRMSPPVDEEADGINCSPCCENDNIRRTFRSLILGQMLSLCLVGTGVSSQYLSMEGINTPAAQSFCNYFLLCFVYGTSLSCKGGEDGLISVIRRRGWKYFLLALVDVEANFMIVYAYQYTNLTSVQLLDCSTIPLVLLLSWLFLSVRYLISHVVGVCICLIGIACVIWADILDGKGGQGGTNKVLGDGLVLGGAFLYAISNVTEEFLVKSYSRVEYLGMVGVFGTLISGVQLALLEHQQLASIRWTGTVLGSFALFAICMFLFYSLVTVMLQKSSALMFNLVTLSADFYSLLCSIFLFQESFHPLYFVSFGLVIIGSLIYSLRATARRDADEPRRVCPCLFICCCCSDCCFDSDGDSSHGSIQITPIPPPLSHYDHSNGMSNGVNGNDPIICPVHGRKAIRESSYGVSQRNAAFLPNP
ncbi:hypothetical protein PFISCL1PPCAC_20086, partial [Pristionchus fissidentatus]